MDPMLRPARDLPGVDAPLFARPKQPAAEPAARKLMPIAQTSRAAHARVKSCIVSPRRRPGPNPARKIVGPFDGVGRPRVG